MSFFFTGQTTKQTQREVKSRSLSNGRTAPLRWQRSHTNLNNFSLKLQRPNLSSQNQSLCVGRVFTLCSQLTVSPVMYSTRHKAHGRHAALDLSSKVTAKSTLRL